MSCARPDRNPHTKTCRRLQVQLICLATLYLGAASADEPLPKEIPSRRYLLEYPAAEYFCPPVRTAFVDAGRAVTVGRRARQHPNGGYGIAMMEVQGVPLLHTGADYAWFQVGEPVYAVADGVVRLSQPATRASIKEAGAAVPGARNIMDWGNLIVIEHRLPEGDHFCTIYAHLDDDRHVQTGDIVTAGQLIGEVGRKSALVNGGYEPHLHFAVREEALVPSGTRLFRINGEDYVLAEVSEESMLVRGPPPVASSLGLRVPGAVITMEQEGDGYRMPSWLLWTRTPGDKLVGYAPTLDGFVDPTRFLRIHEADNRPAVCFTPTYVDAAAEPGVLTGEAAPKWEIDEWIRPPEDGAMEITDMAGSIVCLVCFQNTCRVSRTLAVPLAKELAAKFAADSEVRVVLVQTPTSPSRRNSVDALGRLMDSIKIPMPVGHCRPAEELPGIMTRYRMRATPWTVIIGADGIVDHSACLIRPAAAIELIESLKRPTVAPDNLAPDASLDTSASDTPVLPIP